jgi:hypothetical protein
MELPEKVEWLLYLLVGMVKYLEDELNSEGYQPPPEPNLNLAYRLLCGYRREQNKQQRPVHETLHQLHKVSLIIANASEAEQLDLERLIQDQYQNEGSLLGTILGSAPALNTMHDLMQHLLLRRKKPLAEEKLN